MKILASIFGFVALACGLCLFGLAGYQHIQAREYEEFFFFTLFGSVMLAVIFAVWHALRSS